MRGNAEASIDAWAGHRFVRITPSNALCVAWQEQARGTLDHATALLAAFGPKVSSAQPVYLSYIQRHALGLRAINFRL